MPKKTAAKKTPRKTSTPSPKKDKSARKLTDEQLQKVSGGRAAEPEH